MQEAGVPPDKAACNILVEKCCKSGETQAMIQILQYMKDNSLVLRDPVYREALKTLKNAGESDILLRQANPHFSIECISNGKNYGVEATYVDSHFTIDRGLSLMFLERQNFVAVEQLLAGMIDKNSRLDPAIISTIVEINCAQCRPSGALLAFEYSMKMGISIDRTAYLALVGALIRTNTFGKVVEIVKEMTRAGHSLDTYLAALLIYRLGYGRRPVSAAKIFDLLSDDEKNSATYTALIAAYFIVGSYDKGLEIYESMQSKGIQPALGTYNVLLDGLQKGDRVPEVEKLRKEKKILQTSIHSQDIVSMEEKICNLLFVGDAVS